MIRIIHFSANKDIYPYTAGAIVSVLWKDRGKYHTYILVIPPNYSKNMMAQVKTAVFLPYKSKFMTFLCILFRFVSTKMLNLSAIKTFSIMFKIIKKLGFSPFHLINHTHLEILFELKF